jgi:hypothetical protein
MLSTCPKCKKQIEHEDFMFEVHCDCGTRFNPFMGLTETPAETSAPAPSVPETPTWQDPLASTEPESNYQESNSVFAELKDFAEGNLTAPSPSPSTPAFGQAPAAPSYPTSTSRPAGSSGDAILTAGDGLPGYRIDAYLAPVSAAAELDSADPNPMRKGFDALWSQAVAGGANGVVAMRWVLSPDGTRVVLSGTPVRCTKEGT